MFREYIAVIQDSAKNLENINNLLDQGNFCKFELFTLFSSSMKYFGRMYKNLKRNYFPLKIARARFVDENFDNFEP